MPESSVFHSESILYDLVWIQYEIYFILYHLKDICGSGIYPTWILCAIVKYSKCSKCQKSKPHKQVITESRSILPGIRFIVFRFRRKKLFLWYWNMNKQCVSDFWFAVLIYLYRNYYPTLTTDLPKLVYH